MGIGRGEGWATTNLGSLCPCTWNSSRQNTLLRSSGRLCGCGWPLDYRIACLRLAFARRRILVLLARLRTHILARTELVECFMGDILTWRPSSNMQLLALRHQTPPCQRIRILTTKQRTHLPAPLRIDDPQTRSIAIRPLLIKSAEPSPTSWTREGAYNQFLIPSRHQLPLMIQNLSFVTDQHR